MKTATVVIVANNDDKIDLDSTVYLRKYKSDMQHLNR